MENEDGEVGKGVPSELYKYYSPSGVERTIFDNTIKWEVPCEENDPFEALPNGWDEELIRSQPDYRPGKEMWFDAIYRRNEAQQKVSLVAAFISFTKNKKEKCESDILMWAHYGEKYKGACLEFDIPCLLNGFPENRVALRSAIYDSDKVGSESRKRLRPRFPMPPRDQDWLDKDYQERAIEFLRHKANEWSYEEEWRLITTPVEAEVINCKKVKDVSGEKYILVSDIPHGAITKLIFGCNMPTSMRLALAKQIRIKHPECKFAEVVPDRQRYELKTEPLELVAGIDSTNQTLTQLD